VRAKLVTKPVRVSCHAPLTPAGPAGTDVDSTKSTTFGQRGEDRLEGLPIGSDMWRKNGGEMCDGREGQGERASGVAARSRGRGAGGGAGGGDRVWGNAVMLNAQVTAS
jgi:hypothetical protein